jgi:hypothetical protein
MTASRVIAGVSLLALYLFVASCLKASDPVLLLPKVRGEIVALHKPYLIYEHRAIAPDYWFGAVADSTIDLCRSSVVIYENDQPLLMHSDVNEIAEKGGGIALHWRSEDLPEMYAARSVFMFSASDNTNPATNGRMYWAVKPELDAITCPDMQGKYVPPPYSGLATTPRAVIRLRNFEVSPNHYMILSRDIEAFSDLGDSPEDEYKSPALLFEDGRPLGPARATDIATKGLGGYSHRKTHGMVFSTSDNSDPRKNGRRYYVVIP